MAHPSRTGDQLNLATASDAMLLELTRDGFHKAFGELWSRHHGAVIAAARSFTSFDAEDLTQEAFERVYNSIAAGGEVPVSFRAYVATTARRIAIDMSRRDRGVFTHTYDDELDSIAFAEADFSDRVLENSVTSTAFRELPTRQREVLWYRDVEDLPVQEIARYVGMTPNATTVLIKRAREAFKVAWITAQLAPHRNLASECRSVVPKLAKFSRGTLAAAEQARIELHVMDCVHCAALATEANDLHKKLALVLLPLLLGGGAGSYLEWIQRADNRVAIPTAANRVPVVFTGATTSAGGAAAGAAASTLKLSGTGAAIAVAATLAVLGAGIAGAATLFTGPAQTREFAWTDGPIDVSDGAITTPTPLTPTVTIVAAVDELTSGTEVELLPTLEPSPQTPLDGPPASVGTPPVSPEPSSPSPGASTAPTTPPTPSVDENLTPQNPGSNPSTGVDTPEPGAPEPGNPEPGNPVPETPEPGTPEPSAPEPGTPQPETPEPGAPEPGTSEPGTPEPGMPEPGTPEPETPEPSAPEPETPEPGTPEPEAPEPGTPEPETPEPSAPEPGTSEPEAPEPETPEPETPEPGVTYADPVTLSSVTTTSPFLVTISATPGATITIGIRWQESRVGPYIWDYVTLTADENGEASHDFAAHTAHVRYVEITQTYATADGDVTPTGVDDVIVFENLYIPGVRP